MLRGRVHFRHKYHPLIHLSRGWTRGVVVMGACSPLPAVSILSRNWNARSSPESEDGDEVLGIKERGGCTKEWFGGRESELNRISMRMVGEN